MPGNGCLRYASQIFLALRYDGRITWNAGVLGGQVYVTRAPVPYYHYPSPSYQIDAILRETLVMALLTGGTALYIFKQQAKIAYGISEIAVGILSNVVLLQRIDVSQFPKLGITWQDWINVGAFT
jgi:hypothetical protein